MVSTVLTGVKMRRWTAATWVTVTVTAVFFLGAYAGPGWVFSQVWHGHESLGLWQRCTRWSVLSSCTNIVDKLEGDPSWLNATRALMSLTGIGLIVTLILFTIIFCLHSGNRDCLLGLQAAVLLLSCILTVAACIVYGTGYDYAYSYLAYSFYFSCVVALGCLLAAVFSILDIKEGDY